MAPACGALVFTNNQLANQMDNLQNSDFPWESLLHQRQDTKIDYIILHKSKYLDVNV